MLYGLEWLAPEEEFPPQCEQNRINEYKCYAGLFDLLPFEAFENCGQRLFANFEDYFRVPMLLGYQRLSTIKLADMVIGAPPSISVNDDDSMTDFIADIRDQTDFDSKLYQALIDYSRYGVTVFRLFNDDAARNVDKGNFTVWDPAEWYPILKKDGTRRIKEHVLVWRTNYGTCLHPDWYLEVQRHPIEGGYYIEEKYAMNSSGDHVARRLASKKIDTAGMPCLVQYVANLPSTTNIYGTSDYKMINELVIKATERMRQILHILDKHADPSMTGPATMLTQNEQTGELEFKASQFYAVSEGEEHPEYMTWNGQLDAAFKALEQLLEQIYIMSEMGEAFLGNTKGAGQAVSGTAMRYKMVSPLEKSRRVANALTLPLKKLIAGLIRIESGEQLRYQDINIIWEDSLPKDPREVVELTRLQTGAPQITPLKHALMENYDMDTVDAEHYIREIITEQQIWAGLGSTGTGMSRPGEKDNPAAPPNPNEKGSSNTPHATGTANTNTNYKKEDVK